MSIKTVLLRTLGLLAMVPATLTAIYFTALGMAWLISALNHPIRNSTTASIVMLLALAAGWAGIISSWQLYYHFLRSDVPPVWWRRAIAGLFLGYGALLMIFCFLPSGFSFIPVFVGIPMLVALVLLGLLISSKPESE
ncbi:hypothetical protein [Pseudomonas sp. EpS/L25]|uniref:hypothetical protein n=1 Tax=Pseudomonas sp. EpS/L25 TaxID=1749078 RepID=UPI00128F580C|nr:hypothetical protein [Pseudomonas sp. EpS/L25]